MDADSRGAAAFAAWRTALTRRLVAEPALAGARCDSSVHGPVFAPYLDLTASSAWPSRRSLAAGDAVRHRRTPPRDRTRSTTRPATRRPGARPTCSARRTPSTSPTTTSSPPAVPAVAGVGRHRHACAAPARCPAITDEAYRGSVARYVWDLADRRDQRLGGADGRLGRPAQPAPPRPARRLGRGPAAADRPDWDLLEEALESLDFDHGGDASTALVTMDAAPCRAARGVRLSLRT